MRRVALLLLALLFSAGLLAQSPFTGFFKPGKALGDDMRDANHEWFFRPAAQLTALQFTYNKETKLFESSTFSSAGIGLGYQHYIVVDGETVNNYGFNAIVVFDASQSSEGSIGVAITANALRFVNLGAGYNFADKRIFLLTGAVWNF